MRNKLWRLAKYLLLSWLVYNSSTFFALPLLMGWKFAIVNISAWLIKYSFYYGYILVRQSISLCQYGLGGLILGMYIGAAVCVYLWWRKQTLFRAWMLAFSATVAGPGLVYIMPTRFMPPPMQGLLGFLCMNIFYLLLIILNYCQKKFWPENRIANRIRNFLKSLCLRT